MQSGFTLLEVIVVLAIMSILAGIVGTIVATSILSTETEATLDKLDTLKDALLAYYEDLDSFPTSTGDASTDLNCLIDDNGLTGWNGPYISSGFEDDDFVKDAWHNEIIYDHVQGTRTCTLTSAGPDGVEGTDDDLVITIDATSTYRKKERRVKQELEVIKIAAQSYAGDHGGLYPSSIDDLFTGGYLSDESYRKDEWQTDYHAHNNQFISYGPDRSYGGGDDVYPY